MKWIESGKRSRMPVTDLRRVTAETADRTEPPPPVLRHAFDPNRRAGLINYGSWDGCAVRWRSWEAWLLGYDGRWRKCSAADVVMKARPQSEQQYLRSFGPYVPPLPIVAFGGDATNGWRSALI